MIFGEDSLQALSLALRFSADRINALISEGWKFFYPESDDEVPFGAYFLHPDWIERLEETARQAEDGAGNSAVLSASP